MLYFQLENEKEALKQRLEKENQELKDQLEKEKKGLKTSIDDNKYDSNNKINDINAKLAKLVSKYSMFVHWALKQSSGLIGSKLFGI